MLLNGLGLFIYSHRHSMNANFAYMFFGGWIADLVPNFPSGLPQDMKCATAQTEQHQNPQYSSNNPGKTYSNI